MNGREGVVIVRSMRIARGVMFATAVACMSAACVDLAGEGLVGKGPGSQEGPGLQELGGELERLQSGYGLGFLQSEHELGEHTSAVVYGIDDRRDVYEHTDPALRFLAMRASVVLMRSWRLDVTKPGDVKVNAPALASSQLLCDGERFRDDPAAGFCSGALIDDDLVLTAGHCIRSMEDCRNTSIVFKFYRSGAGVMPPLVRDDVYHCASIVAREQSNQSGRSIDYAVLQLDRPATPRFTPAPVRMDRLALPSQQQVAIIGSPSGIPLKIDAGGRVRDARDGMLDYFIATTDSFGGNSGSPVYELGDYRLAGILVRGETDYTWTGTCRMVNACQEQSCRGEDITYVAQALDSLCSKQYRPRLCL